MVACPGTVLPGGKKAGRVEGHEDTAHSGQRMICQERKAGDGSEEMEIVSSKPEVCLTP